MFTDLTHSYILHMSRLSLALKEFPNLPQLRSLQKVPPETIYSAQEPIIHSYQTPSEERLKFWYKLF